MLNILRASTWCGASRSTTSRFALFFGLLLTLMSAHAVRADIPSVFSISIGTSTPAYASLQAANGTSGTVVQWYGDGSQLGGFIELATPAVAVGEWQGGAWIGPLNGSSAVFVQVTIYALGDNWFQAVFSGALTETGYFFIADNEARSTLYHTQSVAQTVDNENTIFGAKPQLFFQIEDGEVAVNNPPGNGGNGGNGDPTDSPAGFGQWLKNEATPSGNPVGSLYNSYLTQIDEALDVSDVTQSSLAAAFDWGGMQAKMPTSIDGSTLKPQDYYGSQLSGVAAGFWSLRGDLDTFGVRDVFGFAWLAFCMREVFRFIMHLVEVLAHA